MRVTALAGLFALAVIGATGSKASAQPLEIIKLESAQKIAIAEPSFLAQIRTSAANNVPDVPKPENPPAPIVVKYIVAENDSLSKIAEKHNTTWRRLFDKNEAIVKPDVITAGTELVIPETSESLTERALPEPPQPVIEPVREQAPVAAKPAAVARPRSQPAALIVGSSTGNKYDPGYCTWYVKNKRPDMPNNLGNAATWVSRAAAQGMATGSVPRSGAVGQLGNHVVYVESVNGDDTITISEMNRTGLYSMSTRTVPAATFTYIY